MARSALAVLGPLPALVISDHREPVPDGVRMIESSHPVPDERSIVAGDAVLDLCASLGARDRLLYLLSGGTSALVESLRPGVTLADLAATTSVLLTAGATIDEMNAVRTAISAVKGGGVARAAAPADVVTLAISDVVGDDPAVIGSGPTTHPVSIDPRSVVRRHQLADALPASVLGYLDDPPVEAAPEAGDYEVMAGGRHAAAAAVATARAHGLRAKARTAPLTGLATEEVEDAIAVFDRAPALDVLVLTGETTVVVRGDGRGGRNQQAALAAAILLDGRTDVVFLAAGTDGIDGPTDAAGAVVDGTTAGRGRASQDDPVAALAANDSATWLDAVGARLITGPTGTNVGDLWILARVAALEDTGK